MYVEGDKSTSAHLVTVTLVTKVNSLITHLAGDHKEGQIKTYRNNY